MTCDRIFGKIVMKKYPQKYHQLYVLEGHIYIVLFSVLSFRIGVWS